MFNVMMFLLIFLFLTKTVNSYNYCQLDCNGEEHTMCKYKIGGGMDCPKTRNEILSVKDKKDILDFHNKKRDKLASGDVAAGSDSFPAAENMMRLVWDKELDSFAKRWADQCTQGENDQCRRTMDNEDTGQNVKLGDYKEPATITDKEKKIQRHDRIIEILNDWFKEKDSLEGKIADLNFEPSWDGSAGHFTQMMWAQTIYIGCAYSAFDEEDHKVKYRFVCNYKVKGNEAGFALYRKGEPARGCPSKSSRSPGYGSLCWNKQGNTFGESGAERSHKLDFLLFLTVILLCLIQKISEYYVFSQ